jgi:hypothetical protein
MTTTAELIARVRSNINESSSVATPERTDAELIQWIQDGQFDYIDRVPGQFFPELNASVTFSGGYVDIPANFYAFNACVISHTLSGTTTAVDECFVIKPGETYLINNYPGFMGAWAQIRSDDIYCGPNAFAGTLSYIRKPTTLSDTGSVIELRTEHESAIVSFATMRALQKTNDSLASSWKQEYFDCVKAKGGRVEQSDVKRG